jgi:hypothetical protein
MLPWQPAPADDVIAKALAPRWIMGAWLENHRADMGSGYRRKRRTSLQR